jgi:kojibiose phosphorylase
VVLLLYLLEQQFNEQVIKENFEYYDRRTGHGSSLSPSMYGLVAARLGLTDIAMRYLNQAGQIDLANNMGNAAGGVHAAALGGFWQQLINGFAGVRVREEGLLVDPKLPEHWRRMKFSLMWRGDRLDFDIERDKRLTLTPRGKNEVDIGIFGKGVQTLSPSEQYIADWDGNAWQEFSRTEKKVHYEG